MKHHLRHPYRKLTSIPISIIIPSKFVVYTELSLTIILTLYLINIVYPQNLIVQHLLMGEGGGGVCVWA